MQNDRFIRPSVAPSLISAALLLAFTACDAPSEPVRCRATSECARGVCLDGHCVETDAADGSGDAGPGLDALGLRDDVGAIDAPAACASACDPGHACVAGACVADCRMPLAVPCAAGLVCAEMTGRCVTPGEDCTPSGEFVTCGSAEFAPTCGPGSRCEGDACVAASGCTGVACDVAGVCRGVGCAGGVMGTATGLTLEAVADAPRAAMDAVPVRGRVAGTDLCGLTVTLEMRIETDVFLSAFNDASIFRVDLETGERTAWATGISGVNGLATDPTGALYVLQGCTVGRVSETVRTFTPITTLATTGCSRLAVGLDGALYVSTTLDAWRVDAFTGAASVHGSIPPAIAAWGSTFLTGLAFLDDGSLIVGEHWRSLRRIPPGGGPSEPYADAPALGLTESDNPWNEGMGLGIDGLLYVGVFPSNPMTGFVYRVEADRTTTVVEDLASIRAMVPETNYTGIHGVASGLDGAIYFTNQNTSGSTFEPFGQLLVRRPDGTLRLLASGFNFDWPRGYDGDLVVGTRSLETVTVPVRVDGSFEARLDSPDVDGAFEVRASVVDPATGRVFAARRHARTL